MWHQNQSNVKACKVCEQGLVKDEYHLLFTCSTYNFISVICKNYDDILRGDDDMSVILKRTPRRLSLYAYALFTHQNFELLIMNIPS